MPGDLPTYEEVLKEDAQRVQSSQSAPAPTSPPSRPARPARPSSSKPTGQLPRPTHPAAPAQPNLPWRYPHGYHCSKCNNSGYKLKNGRSCKSCWRRFAPPNNSNSVPALTYGRSYPSSSYGIRPMFQGSAPIAQPYNSMGQPIVVSPGDPRLGGVLCGECRGTGRVTFLFDEDICPLCRGIGRLVA